MSEKRNRPAVLHQWSARRVDPLTLLYVGLVFLVFIIFAYFFANSPEVIKALLIAALGSLLATLPGVISKNEYRITDDGIVQRPMKKDAAPSFSSTFLFEQLCYIKRTRQGFKYFLFLKEANVFRRFWKVHFTDSYSGDVKISKKDQPIIFEILEKRQIKML